MSKYPFVFIPGAYHGAWCFERICSSLNAAGETARGVDLPLCPDRETPVSMEESLQVMDRAIPAGEKVILCGHSIGGHFITAYAQRHPERVAGLVYISATLLGDGCSSLDLPPVQKSSCKPQSKHNRVCKWYPMETEEEKAAVRAYFYSDLAREDADAAMAKLLPQPLDNLAAVNRLTEDRWGSVPRWYVLCTEDRCNSPALQKAMLEKIPCRVRPIASGHFPFIACPEKLQELLLDISREAQSL